MNLLGIILVVLCFSYINQIDSAPTPCEELKDKTCDEPEYEAYRACIEASRGMVREKRQIAMPCQQPHVVEPVVQTVKPFEVLVPVKPLKIVQKPELKSLNRTIIVQPGTNLTDDYPDEEESNFHYRLPLNVTTVIRLTNIVNNTNNIHMPTTINNTNVNNIHVYANLTEQGDDPFEQDEPCCTVVRPKSCQTSTQGVHCKHRKFQTCGPQCTAKVVHIQKRKRCKRATGECEEKIAYVPQPEKPTCVYVEEWPFVVCGKKANMTIICAGCYDHYGRGYQTAYGHSRMQPQCVGCYDDAFNVGPLYRRGPVLQPFYYHQVPCYLSGSCPDSYENCGYGCYGHERIDPAWGPQPGMNECDPSMGSSNSIYYNPDCFEETNDWGVSTAKCAVVTDGKIITVKNCTDEVDNPFLAAPKLPSTGKGTKTGAQPPTLIKPTEAPNSEDGKTTVPPTTIQTLEKEDVEESNDDITNPDEPSENDDEDIKVPGSGNGPMKNEVSFVEEYIDDEDFIL
ncbi:uncharacterized protein LOC131285032 [Anopheles ziemanni]|uniref:uncharacterized protein LOC131263046 n=1 Tax=Anopheles coustani TaxID=139045 RepID=UPI00265A6DE9|nr:uncharacterized protein LOC131263046 [Anopheles coustani]XP_058169875.1 uncharacterized protein LOC131285032 [Anopheles ziemanni]